MKVFTIDKQTSKPIEHYGSTSVWYLQLLKTSQLSSIGFMTLEPNGVVGYHKAPIPQLFLVMQGEGWVCGEDRNAINVKTGDGVFWDKGEGHESGSYTGMTVLVVQSNDIDLHSLME